SFHRSMSASAKRSCYTSHSSLTRGRSRRRARLLELAGQVREACAWQTVPARSVPGWFPHLAGYKRLTILCVRKWPDEKSCLLSCSLPSGLAPVWGVFFLVGRPLLLLHHWSPPRTSPEHLPRRGRGQSSWPNCLSNL